MSIAPDTTILDKYRIVRLLGQGGMARVWLAEEMGFGRRQVAIKEPLPAGDNSGEIQRRFTQELTIYAALEEAHAPNLVRVITVEQYAGQPLLVMEYLPNGDLAALIAQHPSGLPVDQAVKIAGQVLAALTVAHDHPWEIVHRDIKPANVLFDGDGAARLADFGLAQLAGASQRSLVQGQPHPGTPAYMAPEQAGGTLALTPAADIYAVGAVLFELLTGKRYNRMPPGTTARSLRSDILSWLDAAVAKALQPEPYARYETAGVMAAALETAKPRSAGRKKSSPQVVMVAPEAAVAAQKRVLRVAVDGSQEYTSIQKAIDTAESGSTIEVYPGIYSEAPVVRHEVHILGIGKRHNIVIETEGMMVLAEAGSIENLTLACDSSPRDSTPVALSLSAGRFQVRKCEISAFNGIGVRIGSAARPLILGNAICGAKAGIEIERNGRGLIQQNKIDADNKGITGRPLGRGILVYGGSPTVRWNRIYANCAIWADGRATGDYSFNYLGASGRKWHIIGDSKIDRYGNLRISFASLAIIIGVLVVLGGSFGFAIATYGVNGVISSIMAFFWTMVGTFMLGGVIWGIWMLVSWFWRAVRS